MRYADPRVCPDCRSDLPHGAPTCPSCDLPVRHPLATELFRTLTRADSLVADLRALKAVTVPAATQVAAAVPPAPVAAQASGVRLATVPKILLGLGALCLLVAAVVFLAVSWAWLGVGGRTTVLVALTLLAGASASLLHRFDLRVAAESLITVALGLLALDVLGADNAGWLGDTSGGAVTAILGGILAVAGVLAALPRPAGQPRLVAPQIVAGLGLAMTYLGALLEAEHELPTGHVMVAIIGAVAIGAHRGGLRPLAWSAVVAAVLPWTLTAAGALNFGLLDPTLHEAWVDGSSWSLLATAATLVVPGIVLRKQWVSVAGANAAGLIATVALTLPAYDERTSFTLAALAAAGAWTAGFALLPDRLRPMTLVPAAVAALNLTGMVAVAAMVAVDRWSTTAQLEDSASTLELTLHGTEPITEPLAVVPATVLVVAFLAFAHRHLVGRQVVPGWLAGGGLATGLAGVVTLASYDVRLVLVTGALVLLAIAATTWTKRVAGGELWWGLAALALAAVAATSGLPDSTLLAITSAIGFGIALLLHLRSRGEELPIAAAIALAPFLGTTVAAVGDALDFDAAVLGVPVLLAVGALALVRPRLEVEVPALLVGAFASVAAIDAAGDQATSLAIHLTFAGALVTATSLVHPDRRRAAWGGGVLLVLATWVRLYDIGVDEPEPYTLPAAVALTLVGLWHLRSRSTSSTLTALLPGLLLATVPSLLWVLDDPVSLRALLLGLACLALTLVGATLRWSAPLVVGAAVGAVLAVREWAPYSGSVSPWVWLALAGVLLTVVGITWERRLHDLQRAIGQLGRLR